MIILEKNFSVNKSLLHFSTNFHGQNVKEINDCLGMECTSDLGKHLGIPSFYGRVTKNTFKVLLDEACSRLVG